MQILLQTSFVSMLSTGNVLFFLSSYSFVPVNLQAFLGQQVCSSHLLLQGLVLCGVIFTNHQRLPSQSAGVFLGKVHRPHQWYNSANVSVVSMQIVYVHVHMSHTLSLESHTQT